MVLADRFARRWKVENIIVVSLLVTNEGIQRIEKLYPNTVRFVVGDVQELDENGRVKPGVGDMGDRLYFSS